MMKLKARIATVLAIGAMLFMAPAAMASTNVVVSGNGAGSHNRVFVNTSNRTFVTQRNVARFDNDVRVFANTGGNRASFNTGGNVVIRTGDINSFVRISNRANVNSVILRDRDRDRDCFIRFDRRHIIKICPTSHVRSLHVFHDRL